MEEDQYLPFRLNEVKGKIALRARRELNEPDDNEPKINELRQLLKEEKNLFIPLDDSYLLQFLRPAKFNVKRAASMLKNFYSLRKGCGDIYDHYDPEAVRRLMASGHVYALPRRDADGCVVTLMRLDKWTVSEFDVSTVLNTWSLLLMHCVDDAATQVTGLHLFCDAKHMTFEQLRQFSPRHMYLFARGLKDSLPIRVRGIHLFNAAKPFRLLWSAVSLFLSEKLTKRVHFYNDDLDSLHKNIPKALLPTEYGGVIPQCLPDEAYLKGIEQFEERYTEVMVKAGYKKM